MKNARQVSENLLYAALPPLPPDIRQEINGRFAGKETEVSLMT